jgi:hypothetical protein
MVCWSEMKTTRDLLLQGVVGNARTAPVADRKTGVSPFLTSQVLRLSHANDEMGVHLVNSHAGNWAIVLLGGNIWATDTGNVCHTGLMQDMPT